MVLRKPVIFTPGRFSVSRDEGILTFNVRVTKSTERGDGENGERVSNDVTGEEEEEEEEVSEE
jgi:hypothetical protein